MSLRGVVTMVMLCGALLSSAARAEAQRLVGKGVKAGVAVAEIGGGIGDLIADETRIGVSAGYTVGLTNVWGSQSQLDAHNRALAVMAGYRF